MGVPAAEPMATRSYSFGPLEVTLDSMRRWSWRWPDAPAEMAGFAMWSAGGYRDADDAFAAGERQVKAALRRVKDAVLPDATDMRVIVEGIVVPTTMGRLRRGAISTCLADAVRELECLRARAAASMGTPPIGFTSRFPRAPEDGGGTVNIQIDVAEATATMRRLFGSGA